MPVGFSRTSSQIPGTLFCIANSRVGAAILSNEKLDIKAPFDWVSFYQKCIWNLIRGLAKLTRSKALSL